MGSHNNGDPVRQRPVVHDDGRPQEVVAPPEHRRYPRRLPHSRRRRITRRHPHRPLRRARPLLPLPAGHQLARRRLRRRRRHAITQTDCGRRIHHRVEHSRHFHHLCLYQFHSAVADAGGGIADRRRRRARRGGLCSVGGWGEVRFHEARRRVG